MADLKEKTYVEDVDRSVSAANLSGFNIQN